MKKAAIVTIYGEFNYGNRLQNYAAAKTLEKLGFVVESLAFIKKPTAKAKAVSFLKGFASTCLRGYVKNKKCHIVREANFKHFTKKYIRTRYIAKKSGVIPKNIASEYDLFFTGSDQVFNPCFGGFENLFGEMLLTFVPKEKKRCLSPSFGVSSLPDEWREPFRKALSDFSQINVRESEGAKIVKELTGREAAVTIDPTLMLDADEWSSVSKKPSGVYEDYVLDYFLGKTPSDTLEYNECQNAKSTIKLLDKTDKNIYVSGPSEFIYLIKNASLVRTDSFHACVFSIIFSKPFAVFKREDGNNDMLSRIETLLSMFGICASDTIGKVIKIDDEIRDSVLSQKRQELLEFLK